MKTALIITTYNHPKALAAVLTSAFNQRRLPDEILIADDGSGAPTRQMIARYTAKSPVPLQHIWQEDRGFRPAKIRNRAILATDCSHLIIIDGDMLLHPDFIGDHRAVIRPGCFVQGSRVLLTSELTDHLLHMHNSPEKCVLPFYHRGIKKSHAAVRLPWLSRCISVCRSQSLKAVKSCNMGLMREDVYRVNGFNNEFVGWGREDSEFVARLYHSGVRRCNLKFAGIAYHLWHEENSRQYLPANDQLLEKTLSEKLICCRQGLAQCQ